MEVGNIAPKAFHFWASSSVARKLVFCSVSLPANPG
jgi:hypothetical protein